MIDLARRREPGRLDLGHGVVVQVRPCTSAMILAARAEASRERGNGLPFQATLLRALAKHTIEAWDGVGFNGEPAPVTEENVAAVMELWPVAEAFERLYLVPALLLQDQLDAEKNGSTPAPNGISVAGPDTVAAAE